MRVSIMGSPSTPNKRINDAAGDENKNCDGRPKSQFQKTVCLEDWWLLKAENDSKGSGLAVAGLASREQRAMRVFSSAPIHKRYDVFTLETADGICVIIKGFINKARTAENGFPSDVFDHFVFGFPPYWKEYAEKCIVAGGQSHMDSHEREVGCQDKMGTKGLRRSNRTASPTVVLPPQSDSVVSGMHNNIVSSIVPGGLENKFCSRGSSSDDQMTPNMPVNCLNKKLLTTSRLGGNAIIPAVIDKDVDPQNHGRGILSACRFINESRATRSSDDQRKVKSDSKIPVKSKFDGDMSLPDGNICHTKSRETAISLSKLESKHKKDKKSCLILGGEKTRSNSVLSVGSGKAELASVDREPEGRNNFHSEASGLKETADKMNLKVLDAGFVNEKFERIAETLNQDKDLKTKGSTEKANVRVSRSDNRPAAADNKKEHTIANKINASENDGTSVMKPRRKLTCETPGSEKERVHSGSALSLSFNRSRSGRLLMPTLEFWRNQRAFYDADGTVTGIAEEINLEQPTRGSRSTTQRKRRRLL